MAKVIETNIESLVPDNKNFNKGTQYGDHLMDESLRRFGLGRSILIDKNNRIIAGNKTAEKAADIGFTDVVVVEVDGNQLVAVKRKDIDLDSAKGRELALADNATGKANLAWDEELIAEMADKWDFEPGDWGVEIADDEEEQPAQQEEPETGAIEVRCKPGDIWQLGNHRLMCGDSIDLEQVKQLFGGVKIDMLLTDPPYNVDYKGKTKDNLKILNDKQEDCAFLNFLCDAFYNADQFMKDGAIYYIWHADLEGLNFRKAVNNTGWLLKQVLIWNKNRFTLGRQDYQWKHEPCLYGWKPGAKHLWYSDRRQATVIDWDKPQVNGEHPTMKPIGLFSYLISNSSKEGDIVYDMFGGSGTTLLACETLKRICYMMELDPKFCDVILSRWEKQTGGTAILLNRN